MSSWIFVGRCLKETQLKQRGRVLLECFFFFFPAAAFLFAFSEIANPSDGPDRSPALLVFVLLLLSGPACSRSDLQPVFQSGANVPL